MLFRKRFEHKLFIFLCLIFNSAIFPEGFAAGTKVLTTKGLKSIELIREGEELIVFNADEFKFTIEKVENVKFEKSKTCTLIEAVRQYPKGNINLTIRCNSNQQLYVSEKNDDKESITCIKASELRIGKHKLFATDGDTQIFDEITNIIEKAPLEKPFFVSLELPENKTFIITENGYIVHNFSWAVSFARAAKVVVPVIARSIFEYSKKSVKKRATSKMALIFAALAHSLNQKDTPKYRAPMDPTDRYIYEKSRGLQPAYSESTDKQVEETIESISSDYPITPVQEALLKYYVKNKEALLKKEESKEEYDSCGEITSEKPESTICFPPDSKVTFEPTGFTPFFSVPESTICFPPDSKVTFEPTGFTPFFSKPESTICFPPESVIKQTVHYMENELADESIFAKPLNRGSTGRTEPATLEEQLALKEVRSNPYPLINGKLEGAKELEKPIMTDPRWHHKDGWVKIAQNINGIEIHYVYNKVTEEIDDIKFKK